MLTSLHIENVAVIKTLNLDFSKGFTVLTGETGAGKSIILGSVRMLLGAAPTGIPSERGKKRPLWRSFFRKSTTGAVLC